MTVVVGSIQHGNLTEKNRADINFRFEYYTVYLWFEQFEGLNTVISLWDEYCFLLSAAIAVCMYLARQVARVFTSVSQTFLVAAHS
jgi:hypothetical protein